MKDLTRINRSIHRNKLLNGVSPIIDNSTTSYWAKIKDLPSHEWHYITIVVENGVRTNYIDDEIVL